LTEAMLHTPSDLRPTTTSEVRLVALPGTLLDERSLVGLLDALRERWPGRLRCSVECLGEASTFDAELDRLARRVERPAWWLGHSLGGIAALHLARRHPHAVTGLLLLGANARAGIDTSEARRQAQWALARRDGLEALVRRVLAPDYGLSPSDTAIEALVAQAQAVGLSRFEHQLAYAAQREGLTARTSSPTARSPGGLGDLPLLALAGEHDDLCPPPDSEELAALSSRGRFGVVPAAGHLLPLEAPMAVADSIFDFLQLFSPTSGLYRAGSLPENVHDPQTAS
jgi:pimeloyl-ACP methyl ester carboxylesterase